jgi:hypothetical protein
VTRAAPAACTGRRPGIGPCAGSGGDRGAERARNGDAARSILRVVSGSQGLARRLKPAEQAVGSAPRCGAPARGRAARRRG